MRLTRVFVDAALAPQTTVLLAEETASHLTRVLRARVGADLVLFNGDGCEYDGAIDSIRGSAVAIAVAQRRPVDRESPLRITLVQSVPRGDRMDFILQKATELGVHRIVPVLSQRSVVRLDDKQAAAKLLHWRAICVNACEQCGRNVLPTVEQPRQLIDHLVAAAPALRLVMSPRAGDNLPPQSGLAEVEIIIGPEGGFEAQEMQAMRVAGIRGIRLGPRILRTETAAVAALTWLQLNFGDLQT